MMNLITGQLRDQRPPVPSSPAAAGKPAAGGGFGRLLAEIRDVLNPLQHLPVLSGLYRALSKDQISPTANLLGGLVYGGPIGAAVAMVQNLANRIAGKDLMASAWQRVVGNPAPPASPRPDKAIASAPGHAPLAPPAAAHTPRPAQGPAQGRPLLALAEHAATGAQDAPVPAGLATRRALATRHIAHLFDEHPLGAIARWHVALAKQEAALQPATRRRTPTAAVRTGVHPGDS
jgi:hypothetical protein